MGHAASQPGIRRAILTLAVLLLSSCTDAKHPAVEQKTVTAATTETTRTATGPIELHRFGNNSSSGAGGKSGPSAAIYAGTGMQYTPVVQAGGAAPSGEGDVSLDFVNADIRDVTKSVLGDLLGLNYVVDNTVQGTITVQTSQKLRRDQVLTAFETVLHINGMALVQRGGFYSVVPYGAAAKASSLGSQEGGYGTEIVTLRNVSPEQMRRVLDPIVPQGTIVQVDQSRNLMVIGGTEGERAAIREQVATFDVDWLRGMSFALFKPRIATAKQMVDDLKHVMGDENGPMAGQVRLVPIERMNAVLAISSQAKYLEEIRTWVARLDQGNDSTDRRIFVYYVQNGRAGDLANVLGKALGIKTNITGPQQGAGTQPGRQMGGSNGSGVASSGTSFGAGQMQGSAPRQVLPPPSGGDDLTVATADQTDAGSQPAVSITADEVNNALLIVATPAEYGVIEAALKRLDILPLQVLIEAAIAEVTLTKDLNFGVQWKFDNGTNQATLSGATSGLINPSYPGFNYLYSSGTRISAVLNALQAVTHVDVLSAPKLMVLNNQTAVLQVGDQVPIATQSAVSTLTPDAPVVNSIEYKDTGVILTVTPRVNDGGLVLMDISQEVSDVSETTSSTLNSPTINERKIGSTVAVQDGQTIALGGLIKDERTDGRSGIPFLQSIPLLGQIFRQDTHNTTRTELLVLITPRVVRDGREAAAITDELRQQMTELKDEFGGSRGGKPRGAFPP